MNFYKRLSVAFLSLCFIYLSGCATQTKEKYEHIETNVEQETLNPAELVERTRALFSRAENLGLDFYSPTYYQSALDALKDAEFELNRPDRKDVSVVRACLAAKRFLEKAQENRNKVDRNLKFLIKHRNLLLEIGAQTWLPNEWNSVSTSIKELVVLIEEEQIQAAINLEPGVREDMYELEINTLLKSTLDAARKTLASAKGEQAEIYAPQYYNNADILIDDTQVYIRANYRDRKGIAKQAEKARLEAERALKTAVDADIIFDLDENEAEPYLVALKKKINTVVQKFQEEGLPPSTLDEALDSLLIITESYTIEKQVEPEPEAKPEEYYEDDSAQDIEVLQVLETLELEAQSPFPVNNSLEEQNTQIGDDEQSFDEIEYMTE